MRPLSVLALGARTPVGLGVEATVAAVRAGVSRVGLHPCLADRTGSNLLGAIDGRLDPARLGWQRLPELALPALAEAIGKLGRDFRPSRPVPVLLALPEARPGCHDEQARQAVSALQAQAVARGLPVQVELVARGHAGGLQAFSAASEVMEQRWGEVCIVGGVDSYFDYDTLDWLQEHRQLATAETRLGFIPGEGAGFVALAHDDLRRALRLPALGVVRGAGTARESKLIKTDDINLGEGLGQAIAAAVSPLRLPDEAVDAVYCDVNGERYRTEEWAFALLALPHAFRDGAYVTPVDSFGDVGAASGPLFCALAVRSWQRGYAPGPRALCWGSSERGLRAAVLLERAEQG
jgi:3-oxoacyl-[acyl-carrier-protein] synthase I